MANWCRCYIWAVLTSLDAFLLACISEGINTPYSLKASAGVSIGAIRPALERLRTKKFVIETANTKNNRERREFKVTSSGKSALDEWVRNAKITDSSHEIEDVARHLALAYRLISKDEAAKRVDTLLKYWENEASDRSTPIQIENIAVLGRSISHLFKVWQSMSDRTSLDTLRTMWKPSAAVPGRKSGSKGR